MTLGAKIMKAYFNFIYNPLYDFTTAHLAAYQTLQTRCIDKLEFDDGNKILCVGVGTGNEVIHILKRNNNVSIVGVDYSDTALQKAYKKAAIFGKKIEGFIMDVQCLEFTTASFDKALCIHVMDFAEENEKITTEILRVLKDRGQFVITYPSGNEDARMGFRLLEDSIRHKINLGKNRLRAFLESLAQIVAGIVYLPILLRSKKRTYTHQELKAIIAGLSTREFQIEEYRVSQDFIVSGRK